VRHFTREKADRLDSQRTRLGLTEIKKESKSDATLIRLEGIFKRYLLGENLVNALNGVDLQISEGEFVSVMGPSGSGKSTLLQIIGGLDLANDGSYFLQNQEISSIRDRNLAKIRNQHFGFVFQSFHLFQHLTTLENVELPLVYAGIGARERQLRAKGYLEAVGLTDRLNHRPAQLSGGQQQRVAIARALVNNPTVILADEPTGNLSREGGDEILALFEHLHREGATIIVVTHDVRVGHLAERCVVLEDGQVVEDSPVLDRTQLEFEVQ
jgi:putative ABC transport system ATP-binding protein